MHRERGAVMVEMAIVVPILVLLVFGMLEFGLAFKDKLTMAHAVNQATRNATVLGTDARADFEILNAFEAGMVGAVGIDSVIHVDIFRADANGNPVAWDRYTPDGTTCGWAPCPDPDNFAGYGVPANYPPCSRDTELDDIDGVDTIGIQVAYQHSWITGVLGLSSETWHETARGRMEPNLFGTGGGSC
jgi:hypothetical protein